MFQARLLIKVMFRPVRKISVLDYITISLVPLLIASEVFAQPTKAERQTSREQIILREFRQNLGKRLKVFRAIPADLSRRGEIFVVAVTQDSNDYSPKLRIFLKSGNDYKEEFVTRGGEVFNDLFIDDVNKDDYVDVVALWQCGQLKCITIVGYEKGTGGLKVLLDTGGRDVRLRSAPDGTKEVIVTSRTYEEKPGEVWTMATAVYHWNGTQFVKITNKKK